MARKVLIKILVMASVLFVSASVYASTTITMTADKTTASVEDSIILQVTVEGSGGDERPYINGIDSFDVDYAGTSSQMQIVNGQMSSSKVYQYILVASGPGSYTVGPAVTKVKGELYQSNVINIKIVEGYGKAPEEASAYITADIDNKKPYVGEQMVYTFKFVRRVPVQNAQVSLPGFEGFWKEEMGEAKTSQQIRNGEVWEVSEIRFALFATTPGEVVIPATSLKAEVIQPSKRRPSVFDSPFFEMFGEAVRRNFHSKPIKLNIQPLPEEGKPRDFSGLVGNFSISAEISQTSLEVGDSATVTIRVSGDGDLRNFQSPKLDANGNFKIYDDKPSLKVGVASNRVREIAEFKKAVVPLKPGKLTLAPFELSYFYPAEGRYITISTAPIALNIGPSSKPETVIVSSGDGEKGVAKQEIEMLGEDLMPIKRSLSVLRSDVVTTRLKTLFMILIFVPPLIFTGLFILRRRLKKIREDAGYVKRGRAYGMANRQLRDVKCSNDEEFYKYVFDIMRDFLGNKFNMDGRALTAADSTRRLAEFGVAEELCKSVTAFLGECEVAIYGGKKVGAGERERVTEELKKLLKGIK